VYAGFCATARGLPYKDRDRVDKTKKTKKTAKTTKTTKTTKNPASSANRPGHLIPRADKKKFYAAASGLPVHPPTIHLQGGQLSTPGFVALNNKDDPLKLTLPLNSTSKTEVTAFTLTPHAASPTTTKGTKSFKKLLPNPQELVTTRTTNP